ncbi:MAG: alpha/beta hydrolase [Prevotella sp.]|nr:alpha/beta hydrolase [Prevotella sp.]MBP5508027.1 alpha/beta hydrolase [Prevotella sp.]
MNTKKLLRKLLLTFILLVAFIIVAGLGIWLIDGRSPQAFVVAHLFHQSTMEDYEKGKGDMTDKSTVAIPEGVEFTREVKQFRIGGMQVFEVAAEDSSKPIVLYIHGGAYYLNFSSRHWKAMAGWAETTGCGIVAPNYPLLYRYTVKDAFPLMLQLYRQLQERYSAKRIIVMGDSAGGGFSLALAQELQKTDSMDLPSRLVLISPWVDVTGGDDALQEYDTFLNNEVLRHVGANWAGDIDARDPIVSPLYGDMQGLPPTDLFTGTWEVFYTDIVKTCEKMKSAGVDVRLHVKEKMGHVYPLWPCPEGKEARKEIANIINNG